MKAAARWLHWQLRVEQAGTTLAFVLMVAVLGWDIWGREVLGGGKIWATPVAVYANVFLSFIGMGIASSSGAHLRPKFFDKHAPQKLDALFNRFTDIGFALFCLGAAALCLHITRESVALQETDPVLQWQIWPFQVFLVAAFVLAAVRHGLYAAFPALRPADAGGDNAAPSEEQVKAFAAPEQGIQR
jgi:TRAP-type C4-dicarboxylate transport system permease small subunit